MTKLTALIAALSFSASVAQAVSNGLSVPLSAAPSSVEIYNPGVARATCTATKIGEHAYLTAAHCVGLFGIGLPIKANTAGELELVQVSDATNAATTLGGKLTVSKVTVHPSWNTKNLDSSFDLAVIETVGTTPQLPIAHLPHANTVAERELVYFGGYGLNEKTVKTSLLQPLRGLLAKVQLFENFAGVAMMRETLTDTSLGFGKCVSGDSGGGIMIAKRSGDGSYVAGSVIIGVASRGNMTFLNMLMNFGGHTIFTRLDRPDILAWLTPLAH